MTQYIILTVGSPASGKSFWAKQLVEQDSSYVRINNDDLRSMLHNSAYSKDNEKIIKNTRQELIKYYINKDKNIIIDNVNVPNSDNFDEVCKIAELANKDIVVSEKIFYEDLDILIERDSKRIGSACVGKDVVTRFYNKLGKTQFKNYKCRTKTFLKKLTIWKPLEQDASLPRTIVCDMDGTLALIHSGRSPYDASTADKDHPHIHVVECMRLYFNAGYKIFLVSGREDKDRLPTEQFCEKYFPEVKYELHMRKTGDMRKDVIIKEEIYNEFIKNKYYISMWLDDRKQIVEWLFLKGIPFLRANDPNASF